MAWCLGWLVPCSHSERKRQARGEDPSGNDGRKGGGHDCHRRSRAKQEDGVRSSGHRRRCRAGCGCNGGRRRKSSGGKARREGSEREREAGAVERGKAESATVRRSESGSHVEARGEGRWCVWQCGCSTCSCATAREDRREAGGGKDLAELHRRVHGDADGRAQTASSYGEEIAVEDYEYRQRMEKKARVAKEAQGRQFAVQLDELKSVKLRKVRRPSLERIRTPEQGKQLREEEEEGEGKEIATPAAALEEEEGRPGEREKVVRLEGGNVDAGATSSSKRMRDRSHPENSGMSPFPLSRSDSLSVSPHYGDDDDTVASSTSAEEVSWKSKWEIHRHAAGGSSSGALSPNNLSKSDVADKASPLSRVDSEAGRGGLKSEDGEGSAYRGYEISPQGQKAWERVSAWMHKDGEVSGDGGFRDDDEEASGGGGGAGGGGGGEKRSDRSKGSSVRVEVLEEGGGEESEPQERGLAPQPDNLGYGLSSSGMEAWKRVASWMSRERRPAVSGGAKLDQREVEGAENLKAFVVEAEVVEGGENGRRVIEDKPGTEAGTGKGRSHRRGFSKGRGRDSDEAGDDSQVVDRTRCGPKGENPGDVNLGSGAPYDGHEDDTARVKRCLDGAEGERGPSESRGNREMALEGGGNRELSAVTGEERRHTTRAQGNEECWGSMGEKTPARRMLNESPGKAPSPQRQGAGGRGWGSLFSSSLFLRAAQKTGADWVGKRSSPGRGGAGKIRSPGWTGAGGGRRGKSSPVRGSSREKPRHSRGGSLGWPIRRDGGKRSNKKGGELTEDDHSASAQASGSNYAAECGGRSVSESGDGEDDVVDNAWNEGKGSRQSWATARSRAESWEGGRSETASELEAPIPGGISKEGWQGGEGEVEWLSSEEVPDSTTVTVFEAELQRAVRARELRRLSRGEEGDDEETKEEGGAPGGNSKAVGVTKSPTPVGRKGAKGKDNSNVKSSLSSSSTNFKTGEGQQREREQHNAVRIQSAWRGYVGTEGRQRGVE